MHATTFRRFSINLPAAGAPNFRYSLSAFLAGAALIAIAFAVGFQTGKYFGFDAGYRQGRWETPEFDESHPTIGPLLKARPRDPRD